jgi:cardiolipin synthase
MSWKLFTEIIYVFILFAVCLRIIYDTRSTSKTLAYLLLAIFVPIGGIIFYFLFGINYRKHLIYSKKLIADEKRLAELNERIISSTEKNLKLSPGGIREGAGLVKLLLHDNLSLLTSGNSVKLLINGEEKFPEVIEALRNAKTIFTSSIIFMKMTRLATGSRKSL